MKFSKAKMLARIEAEGRSKMVIQEVIDIMDKLDGKDVETYCWANQVMGENVGMCEGYRVNLDDCEA